MGEDSGNVTILLETFMRDFCFKTSIFYHQNVFTTLPVGKTKDVHAVLVRFVNPLSTSLIYSFLQIRNVRFLITFVTLWSNLFSKHLLKQ